MANDVFQKHVILLDSPFEDGFTIVPTDNVSTLFAQTTRAIYVGGSANTANVTVIMGNKANTATSLQLVQLKVGYVYNIRAQRVAVTGTDAGLSLVGLF